MGLWVCIALVAAAFALPLYKGLGNNDYQNDEAGHAFSVDVMLKDGDWLTPKSIPSETSPFLEKPPLKFWLVAAPIRLGLLENNEFGQRFWDALFGGVAFVYLFLIGRMLGGPVCGLASVLLLFVNGPLLFEHGLRGNNMESVLVLAYCAGVYHYLAWRQNPSPRGRLAHLVAITLYFVAAFMCKFVAAFFLPAVLAIAATVRRSDRQRLLQDWRSVVFAAALTVALVAPWFLYQFHQFGWSVWNTMFGLQVYTRLTGYLDPTHLHPWYYYFSTLKYELDVSHATTAVGIGLALVLARVLWNRWPEGLAVLLWACLPFAVISVGSSKLYHYAYPFLPPVALAGGYAVSVVWKVIDRGVVAVARPLEVVIGAPLRHLFKWSWLRYVMLGVCVAAVALVVATLVIGRVRVSFGDGVVLRSGGLFRPTLVALVALGAAGYLMTACRLGVPLLVVSMMLPFAAYRRTLSEFSAQNHPLQTLRACLDQTDAARTQPGLYLDGPRNHTVFYYLRGYGPYHDTDNAEGADSAIYAGLFGPRPQLIALSTERLEHFRAAMVVRASSLKAAAAAQEHVAEGVLAENERTVPVGMYRLPGYAILLPAQYTACALESAHIDAR